MCCPRCDGAFVWQRQNAMFRCEQYVIGAIEEQLREDLGEDDEGVMTLTAKADPVLAELWDNSKDSAYDRL